MINVLSLFDGMSCGRIALDRAGVKVGKYYASELDKYAIKVSQANYPDIEHLGDVTKWREWDIDWNIDLLIGGSPCQGFSFAGKQLAFDDPRSALFFVYVDILNHIKTVNPNVKFMLENVRMKKEFLSIISEQLGVEPIFINSALVSAQNRQRYYWCNWDVEQPEDKGILLKDIIDDYPENPTYMSDKFKNRNAHILRDDFNGKAKNLSVMEYVKNGRQGDYIKARPCEPKIFDKNSLCHHAANATDIKGNESIKRVYAETGKSPTLTTMGGGHREPKVLCNKSTVNDANATQYRKLTPLECERLQTVPDNYTNHVSNTQRYKMLGNGWTVDVIAHLFREYFR